MNKTGMMKPENDPTLEEVERAFDVAREKIRRIEEQARKNPPDGGQPPGDENPGGSGAPAAPN